MSLEVLFGSFLMRGTAAYAIPCTSFTQCIKHDFNYKINKIQTEDNDAFKGSIIFREIFSLQLFVEEKSIDYLTILG